MTKHVIPLESGTKAIEPVLGGMRRKQAIEWLDVVHNQGRAYL